METAGDIIRDALSELTVQAQEQTIPAVELNQSIRYLNRMMQALDADGIKLGYTIVNHVDDPLTVPAGAYEGMMYNLAIRMANGYDIRLTPDFMMVARESKKILAKIAVTAPKSNWPSILPIGSGNEGNAEAYSEQRFFNGCCEDEDECNGDWP